MTVDELRQKKLEWGYSCEQIAEKSGVPLGTVQKIFSGITKSPRYDTLRQLEKMFEEDEWTFSNMMRESSAYYVEKKPGEYTLEDYYAVPEDRRVELIDGVIYDMGAPNNKHQVLVGEIHATLRNYIREKKGKCIAVLSPADVQLDCDNKTMLQPDVFVICDRDKLLLSHTYGAPDFVVEILSPSTRKRDIGLKLAKYIDAGVREYWIVDPKNQKIISYDLEKDLIPVIYGFDDSVPVRIFDGDCKVDFAEIMEYYGFMFDKEEQE